MDPSLEEIWSVLQVDPTDLGFPPERAKPEPEPTSATGRTPEAMRDQAYVLSADGYRREAADMLRSAVNLAEDIDAGPRRQIPLLEALAEVLWQLGDKVEARQRANRAIELWFKTRPSDRHLDRVLDNPASAA